MKRITISEDDLLTMTAVLLATDENSPAIAKDVGAIWFAKLVHELFDGVKDCEDGKSCLIKLNRIIKF